MKKWALLLIMVILVITVAALTFLYISGSNKLKTANARVSSLESYVKSMSYPSHFKSLDALKQWLASDDVNTKYASVPAVDRAYILEIRAARDGFILPAYFEQDSKEASKLYFLNLANIAGKFYVVNPANDTVTALSLTLTDPPSLRPLVPAATSK